MSATLIWSELHPYLRNFQIDATTSCGPDDKLWAVPFKLDTEESGKWSEILNALMSVDSKELIFSKSVCCEQYKYIL